MATSSTTSATSNNPVSSLSPIAQFALGAIIVVGIGFVALLSKVFDTQWAWAAIAGYAVTGTAFGVYLLENSTAIHSYIKYLAIIIVSVVGYGLTLFANNYYSGLTAITDPVLIAGFAIGVANFALNDAQQFYSFLPDNVINDITILIGAVVVVAEAVENAPAGSIINASTLLAVAVPVLMAYLFQKIPWPTSTAPTTSTSSTPATPSPTPATTSATH